MTQMTKSGFFWRFAGGFVLGAIGVVTLHPAQADEPVYPPVAATR